VRAGDVPHIIAFNLGYNFDFDLTSIEGLHKKLQVSKMPKVLIWGISELPTW
jgi:hypothetical protein